MKENENPENDLIQNGFAEYNGQVYTLQWTFIDYNGNVWITMDRNYPFMPLIYSLFKYQLLKYLLTMTRFLGAVTNVGILVF